MQQAMKIHWDRQNVIVIKCMSHDHNFVSTSDTWSTIVRLSVSNEQQLMKTMNTTSTTAQTKVLKKDLL